MTWASLAVLGTLTAVLVRPSPVAVAAGAATAVLVGWLLDGWGFWGYALAAAAAALSARLAAAASPAGTPARP